MSTEAVQQDNVGVIFFPVLELSSDVRPVYDAKGDALFHQQVMAQLSQRVGLKETPRTWGELNNQTILALLSRTSQLTIIGDESDKEVYFMTGGEARGQLESRVTLHGPIITEDQQQFK